MSSSEPIHFFVISHNYCQLEVTMSTSTQLSPDHVRHLCPRLVRISAVWWRSQLFIQHARDRTHFAVRYNGHCWASGSTLPPLYPPPHCTPPATGRSLTHMNRKTDSYYPNRKTASLLSGRAVDRTIKTYAPERTTPRRRLLRASWQLARDKLDRNRSPSSKNIPA